MPDHSADPPVAPSVAVVGGGLAGLLAARRLRQSGIRAVVFEAADQIGGNIRSGIRDGAELLPIDVGAEAMHLAAPQVGALIDELDLRSTMVTARRGTSWLATGHGLRPLPDGVGPAGPTRLRPVLRSRILGPAGLVRAALEPVRAEGVLGRLGAAALPPDEDVAVGRFVRSRFGDQVTDRIVDPLLGSLHAGSIDTLSLRACTPTLVPAAEGGRSLVMGARRGRRSAAAARPGRGPAGPSPRPGQPTMSFVSWPSGLATLVERLRDDPVLPLDVRLGTRVTGMAATRAPEPGRYVLHLADGDTVAVDGVILAVPAAAAARLVRSLGEPETGQQRRRAPLPSGPGSDPVSGSAVAGDETDEAAAMLAAIETASVATVVLGFPRSVVAQAPLVRDNGLLVASSVGSLLKAATFLSSKWPHLSGGDTFWLRMSAGRAGSDVVAARTDAVLVDQLRRDLRSFTGLDAAPRVVHVERWPASMPQLTVGHTARMRRVRAALASWPGVALAGASYDGIGLASCISSAGAAAQLVAEAVAPAGRRTV